MDLNGSVNSLKLAADQNDAAAQGNYGFFIEHGLGIDNSSRSSEVPVNSMSARALLLDESRLFESIMYHKNAAE
jgi:TPR repeat protein